MGSVKSTVANNLCELRKSKGLTQQQLAEKFSYSDKSVSKWEHGETLPDIETLKRLCDFYGITLDYLVSEKSFDEKQKEFAKEDHTVKLNKTIITALAVSVVWILAVVIFFGIYAVSKMLEETAIVYWMVFVWAVPVSLLVLIIFIGCWGRRKWNTFVNIFFVWTLLASIYLQVGLSFPESTGWTMWMVFCVGVPLTISMSLFGTLMTKRKKAMSVE